VTLLSCCQVVLKRLLDVVFEYAALLLIGLAVVPVGVGGVTYAFDRTQVVSAQVWADRPVLLKEVPIVNQFSDGSPSQGMETLVNELLVTDQFTNQVLSTEMPGFNNLPGAQRQAARQDLRSRLRIASEGPHVVTFEYTTTRPSFGIALLWAVLAQVRQSIEDIQGDQAASEARVTASQITASQATMQAALSRLHDYVAQNGGDPLALRGDPTYTTLATDALSKSDAYQALQALQEESQLARASLPQLVAAFFRVVDPPAVQLIPITAKTPAVRYGQIAAAGTAILELLLVYLVALRDPRVRSSSDLAHELLIDLGSGPAFGEAA